MNQHQLQSITDRDLRCSVCGQSWSRRPSIDECPGVPVYRWEGAPEHLKTKAQLKQAGLARQGLKPAGALYYKGGWLWLYDERQAVPRKPASEAQKAAIAKAREILHAQTHCSNCGHHTGKPGLCNICTARNLSVTWAKLLLMRQDWVILDTETTDMSRSAEIVQIAVIDPTGDVLMNTLVKPIGAISEEASEVHGITENMVKDAPSFSEIYKPLCETLRGKLVITYNADFDRRVIRQCCQRHGLEMVFVLDWSCAMEQYAEYCGEWSRKYRSFRWQPLPGGDHTALGDCRATLNLIHMMGK